jgi:hypothetical protein
MICIVVCRDLEQKELLASMPNYENYMKKYVFNKEFPWFVLKNDDI